MYCICIVWHCAQVGLRWHESRPDLHDATEHLDQDEVPELMGMDVILHTQQPHPYTSANHPNG